MSGSSAFNETFNDELDKFREYIKRNQKPGYTCDEKSCDYMPETITKQYWNTQKVRTLLRTPGEEEAPNAELICRDYSIIFSILFYISDETRKATRRIGLFTRKRINDRRLPLTSIPQSLKGVLKDDVWGDFEACQWMFCPVSFSDLWSHPELDHRWILPIKSVQDLSQDDYQHPGQAKVVKVVTNSESGLDGNVSDQLVFKAYRGSRIGNAPEFDREKNVYSWLHEYRNKRGDSYDKNIIRCFGTFTWWDDENVTYHNILVLEYASSNLMEMFHRDRPPLKSPDFTNFWKGIIPLLRGCHVLHAGRVPEDSKSCIHQDLKPDNILIFENQPLGSSQEKPYSFQIGAKICDFGLSHKKGDGETKGRDNGGTPTYRSPELTPSLHMRCESRPSDDVWAACCILVEAAVWVTVGEYHRREFMKRRVEEIKRSMPPGHRDAGNGDSFHDGTHVLKCVEEALTMISECRRVSDKVTHKVASVAVGFLKKSENERAQVSAYQLAMKLDKILSPERVEIADIPGSSTAQPPMSPAGTMPSNSPTASQFSRLRHNIRRIRDRPLSFVEQTPPIEDKPNPDHDEASCSTSTINQTTGTQKSPQPDKRHSTSSELTLASLQGRRYKEKYQNSSMSRKIFNKFGQQPAFLSGLGRIKTLLADRDFVLIFDNSESMQPWKGEIMEDGPNLVWLLKHVDTDGIELYCTSDMAYEKATKSHQQTEKFLKHHFSEEIAPDCQVEAVLAKVFDKIKGTLEPEPTSPMNLISPPNAKMMMKKKKTSIYFFTDGAWESSTATKDLGAGRAIRNLVEALRQDKYGPDHVSIQFIRYGEDPVGIDRLDHLDDEVVDGEDWDIVDHKYHQDSLESILIGSLNRGNDAKRSRRTTVTTR